MDNGFSLADAKAIAGDNDGFGGGNGWWIILLFLVLFGGGFGGFGGNRGGAATTDELSAGFNFSNVNNRLNDLVAGQANINQNLGNAICQAEYENARLQNQAEMSMITGFNAIQSQAAQCCCDLKTAIHAEGEATRSMLQQDKIEALQQQVSALQLNAAMCGVPRINTNAYGVYAYPQMGCGCGCPQAAI